MDILVVSLDFPRVVAIHLQVDRVDLVRQGWPGSSDRNACRELVDGSQMVKRLD